MLKRLSAALLFGGLLLGLTPTAAGAGPYDRRDDHYRCMYRCAERGYGRGDGYGSYRDPYRSGYDRYRRDPMYQDGECWQHGWWGWHRCRSGYHYYGGYDSHRHHPRNW